MSIQDIITAIILVILCITFMIFVIAEIIRDRKRAAKHWGDESIKNMQEKEKKDEYKRKL